MNELDPTAKIVKRGPIKSQATVKNISGKGTQSGQSVDRVTLSEASQTQASRKTRKPTTSDIRHDLVNRVRSFLENGTYVVKAEEIADKIVQKIKEDKNRLIF